MELAFYATFRPLVGAKKVQLEVPAGSTVRDLVALIVATWPALEEHLIDDEGELSRHVNLLVGGRASRWLPDGNDTLLDDIDRVDVFPAVAGGL